MKIVKWPQNIVLVRHGESEYNAERALVRNGKRKRYSEKAKNTRNADIELTKNGIEQARATGKFLKNQYKNFDVVFVSPFRRAQQTAECILEAWGGKKPRIVIEDRVREKEFGVFHAITREEIKKKYPDWHFLREVEGKYYFRPPGGENYPDIALRLHSFIGTLARDWRKQNVLIAAHSSILLAFHKLMTRMTEAEVLDLDRRDEIKNCGIIAYRLDPKQGKAGRMIPGYFNKIVY